MKISEEKKERISEQILTFLFQENSRPVFTSHVAREIARDEDFTKNLLKVLAKKGLTIEMKKNKEGNFYLRRSRWLLSPLAYEAYKKHKN